MKPRIVDQNVDGAEFHGHLLKHGADLLFIGHVGRVGIGPAADFKNFLDYLVGLVLPLQLVHHHVGAGLTQRDGHRLADT